MSDQAFELGIYPNRFQTLQSALLYNYVINTIAEAIGARSALESGDDV